MSLYKPWLCPQLEQAVLFCFLHLGKDTVKLEKLPRKISKMIKEWSSRIWRGNERLRCRSLERRSLSGVIEVYRPMRWG